MTRFPIIAAFVIGGLLGATLGLGISASKFASAGPLNEFKVLHGNLAADRPLDPQLREFMKARLYYVAMSLDPKQIAGQSIDFGPVNETNLGKADPRTENVSYTQLYQDVLSRHGVVKR
ncbi:MAG TPA: hypothetical protein VFG14_06485 [Chthoniobacteraceae bacterium]|nr:hypothetical protein [Chthoniobacteraceae bacterium]